jgi:hypothetical protein
VQRGRTEDDFRAGSGRRWPLRQRDMAGACCGPSASRSRPTGWPTRSERSRRVDCARVEAGENELARPGAMAQIDLHEELFSRLLPVTDVIDRSRPARVGDAAVRLPAIEHQLVHLIAHSHIRYFGHAFGRITLRDRLEAAALLRRTPESIPGTPSRGAS